MVHLVKQGAFAAVLAAVALAAACSDDDRWEGGGDSDADGDTDTDTDADSDGDTEDDSCRLVDVVITVDVSSSMMEELAALRDDVFPAFAAQLGEISQGLDNFRIGTLDACPNPANFHTRGNGGECGFSSGEPWIDSESPDMDAEFSCVGDIYIADGLCTGANDDEQPVTAMLTGLNPPWSENQNAGFLRDDALLVVIAMTDEDEQPTVGDAFTADEIFQAVAALKGGDPKKAVFLGVGGGVAGCEGLYGYVDMAATKLKEITDLFIAEERGVWWDLCAGQPLEDGLDAAFAIIDQACDEFVIE